MTPLMYALFTVPNAADVASSSSEYSSGLTTELLPLLYVIIGSVAAGYFINFLARQVTRAIGKVTGGRKGRGRRRSR